MTINAPREMRHQLRCAAQQVTRQKKAPTSRRAERCTYKIAALGYQRNKMAGTVNSRTLARQPLGVIGNLNVASCSTQLSTGTMLCGGLIVIETFCLHFASSSGGGLVGFRFRIRSPDIGNISCSPHSHCIAQLARSVLLFASLLSGNSPFRMQRDASQVGRISLSPSYPKRDCKLFLRIVSAVKSARVGSRASADDSASGFTAAADLGVQNHHLYPSCLCPS